MFAFDGEMHRARRCAKHKVALALEEPLSNDRALHLCLSGSRAAEAECGDEREHRSFKPTRARPRLTEQHKVGSAVLPRSVHCVLCARGGARGPLALSKGVKQRNRAQNRDFPDTCASCQHPKMARPMRSRPSRSSPTPRDMLWPAEVPKHLYGSPGWRLHPCVRSAPTRSGSWSERTETSSSIAPSCDGSNGTSPTITSCGLTQGEGCSWPRLSVTRRSLVIWVVCVSLHEHVAGTSTL